MNEPFIGADGKTYNTEIDVSHLDIYSYDCKKCGEEFMWGKPETVKHELCWGCMQDKVVEIEAKLKNRPKYTLNQKWAAQEIERYKKDQARRNSHIAHLIGVNEDLHDKRMTAVNRAHKLQLKLNNYERKKKP